MNHPWTGRPLNLPMANDLPKLYWIAGGSCGGKTTLARRLSERHGFSIYDADGQRQKHYESAEPDLHPALTRQMNWQKFFTSPPGETLHYREALCAERMEMILADLSHESAESTELSGKPILVDGVYPLPELLREVTPEAPAVFLFADPPFLEKTYFGRESTLWMEEIFGECTDPESAKQGWLKAWNAVDQDRRKRAERAGYPSLIAGIETDWNDQLEKIEKVLLLPSVKETY